MLEAVNLIDLLSWFFSFLIQPPNSYSVFFLWSTRRVTVYEKGKRFVVPQSARVYLLSIYENKVNGMAIYT